MKHWKVLPCAVAFAGFGAGPVLASPTQTTDSQFAGTVANTCVIQPLVDSGANANAQIEPGATSSFATISFSDFADSDTAMFVSGSGGSFTFSGYCNYPHNIQLRTTNGSFQNQTAANDPVAGSAGFADEIPYNVVVTGWAPFIILNATGTAGTVSAPGGSMSGAFSGTATIAISLAPPSPATDPLLAGDWSDTLILQIGAPL